MTGDDTRVLEARYVTDPRIPSEATARLLRYLLDRGADEFTITVMALQDTQAPFADAFEDELAPFELPIAPRRLPAVAGHAPEGPRAVRRWRYTAESLERLLTFLDDGLFHAPPGPDGWLEDLAVFRRAELVLGVVTHEREAVLRLAPREQAAVAALGIGTGPAGQSIAY